MSSTKKNIDLPESVIKILQKLADRDRRKLKPYMEKVLIEHASAHKEKTK